jgi:hypothetical protein
MMFPDTRNNQQLSALRRTAERARTSCNTRAEYARATWKPVPPRREELHSGAAYGQVRYALAPKELSLASR